MANPLPIVLGLAAALIVAASWSFGRNRRSQGSADAGDAGYDGGGHSSDPGGACDAGGGDGGGGDGGGCD